MPSMITLWAIAVVLFLVLEAATVGLASIWFAIGALCALIAALLGAAVWLQVVWFVVVSLVTLALTRPLARKYINNRSQATNADRVIGSVCRVTETIDNISGTGAVSTDGKIWTARSATGEVIESGRLVAIQAINGVKLIVAPAPDTETKSN